MKRPRRVWRTLGARRRIGPCQTCGLSLGVHNRAQRQACDEREIVRVLARIDAKLKARGSSLEEFIES